MEQPEYNPLDRHDFIDLTLAAEYGKTDIADSTLPTTIVVNGTTWTGELVSYPHFLDAQANCLESMTVSPEEAKPLVDRYIKGFRDIAEMARVAISGEAKDDSPAGRPPSYIHLRNARQSGEWTVYPVMRFKLSAVDAWTLGSGDPVD